MTSSIIENLRKHIEIICKDPRTPGSHGYLNTQKYLKKCITEAGMLALEHEFRYFPFGRALNIYAESNPDSRKPRILIGAHYESLCASGKAADDNASAVAVLLEAMNLLKGEREQPYVFVFFDMEEVYRGKALRGSSAFSKFYPKELDKVIIMDLVGGSMAPGFDQTMLQFGNAYPKLSSNSLEFLHLPMKVVEPVGSIRPRSDYHSFRKKKIPFTFFSSGTPWYYHTEFDTPEVLLYDKMAGLVEVLSGKPRGAEVTADGSWEDFSIFIDKFYSSGPLRSRLLKKLKARTGAASTIELVRLYAEVLPKLKRMGKMLWES